MSPAVARFSGARARRRGRAKRRYDPVATGVLPHDRVRKGQASAPVPDRQLSPSGWPGRWLPGRPAQARRRREHCASPLAVRSTISKGSCSTQPGFGKIWLCSSCWLATTLASWSKIMNRVLVVPWSIAPTNSCIWDVPSPRSLRHGSSVPGAMARRSRCRCASVGSR